MSFTIIYLLNFMWCMSFLTRPSLKGRLYWWIPFLGFHIMQYILERTKVVDCTIKGMTLPSSEPPDSRETTNLMLAGSCVYSQGGHHMHDKRVFAGENSGFANCTFHKWHGFWDYVRVVATPNVCSRLWTFRSDVQTSFSCMGGFCGECSMIIIFLHASCFIHQRCFG